MIDSLEQIQARNRLLLEEMRQEAQRFIELLEAMPEDEVVNLKPIPLAHGHRIHGLSLPALHLGKGPQSSRRRRGAPGRVRRGQYQARWCVFTKSAHCVH